MSDYNDPDIDMSIVVKTDISQELAALDNLEKRINSITASFKELGLASRQASKDIIHVGEPISQGVRNNLRLDPPITVGAPISPEVKRALGLAPPKPITVGAPISPEVKRALGLAPPKHVTVGMPISPEVKRALGLEPPDESTLTSAPPSVPTANILNKKERIKKEVDQVIDDVLSRPAKSNPLGVAASVESSVVPELKHDLEIKASEEVEDLQENAFTNSWDSIFGKELKTVQDREKRIAFLKMLGSTVHENIKYTPASTTGKHHPGWANVEGGLIRHSKAVAGGALALAEQYKYTGDRDDLVLAALGHDTQKLGQSGKFYNPAHALEGASAMKSFGLSEAGKLVESHMGTKATGARKGDPTPESQGQKILAEADWLVSRKYAEDYVKFDTHGNVESVDIMGIRKEAIRRKEAKEGKGGYLEILGDVESQEKEKEKAAKEWERSWNNVGRDAKKLYQILADIAKLGLGVIPIAGKVVEAGSNSLSMGDRTYNATTGDQVLGNRLAADIVGIGKNTINEELTQLSAKRGSFSLTGEAGDLLPMALAKNLDELLLSDENVYNVYWQLVDSFAKQVEEAQGKGDEGRVKELMFLTEKTLGAGARRVVDYSVENNIIPSSLTERVAPPGGLLGWQEQIDDVNRAFKIAVDGMKDSITGLSTHFMKEFGVPVATWFDKTLRNIITRETVRHEIEGRSRKLNGLFGLQPSFNKEYDAAIKKQREDWRNTIGAGLNDVANSKMATGRNETLQQAARRRLLELGYNPPEGASLYKLNLYAIEQRKAKEAEFDKALNLKNAYRGDDKAGDNWKSIQYLGMQNTPEAKKLFEGIKTYLPDYVTGHQGRDPFIGDLLEMIMFDVLNKLITPEQGVEDVRKLKESRIDVSVNINNTFPNATNAQEIKQGINESVDGIGRALETFNFG